VPVQATISPLTIAARTFPATADQVREARCFLAGVMGDSPAVADAVTCLSELVTNAIIHTRSGLGGCFAIQVARGGSSWRVSVLDEGGVPWQRRADGDGLTNRGLAIVGALARRWNADGDASNGRVVWFEIADH
jgi:anti-sigma regulatory factor (Ser/Thr protein kinase)